MFKWSAVIGMVALNLFGGVAAFGVTTGLIVVDPTVDAIRSANNGPIEIVVQVSNPTNGMAVLSMTAGSCKSAGTPVLDPMSSVDVRFQLENCPIGLGTVGAELEATLVSSAGRESRAGPITLTLTVKDATTTDWSALWWFLAGFAALLAVGAPYLTWLAFPAGKPERGAKFRWANLRFRRANVRSMWAHVRSMWANVRRIIGKLGSQDFFDKLDKDLPGISSDWNFKDTWATNVGLAASLFTGVFAAAGPLDVLTGADAGSKVDVIVVASAMSAALIGSAPLWLSIFKQRTKQNNGYAKHNTVRGVLVASFFVYFATIGLIATVMQVSVGMAPGTLVLILGFGALALMVLYAWKSIPQTLGLGSLEAAPETAWVVELGPSPEQWLMLRQVPLAPPRTPEARDVEPGAEAGAETLRPSPPGWSSGPSALP